MSWDIALLDSAGMLVQVDKFEEGGTYPVGGTTDATLNITYNYAQVYFLLPGYVKFIEMFEGKKACELLPWLREAVSKLSPFPRYKADYWAPTPGNAVLPLKRMLLWAEQYPDAVWHVS